ncbi:MAG: DUF4097 family beta strand repeat-containing protein [Planctomycetota bacterium]
MRNSHFTRVSVGCLLCAVVFFAGCNTMGAKYQRTVRLSAPLSPGSTFAAETHNGSITTGGADVTDCSMVATIMARAITEEEAAELAEEVEITLEPSGSTLTVRIKKPTFLVNKSVGVSLDITVPNQTNLELGTHNGAVTIADITGRVRATSHNGKVTTEKVSGGMELETHNGSITCRHAAGDAKLRTHNGSVKVFYAESASPVSDISIVTSNGSVELVAAPGLSAQVEATTHNGSINTDLPITVRGEVTKRKLTGTIGSGEGRLRLETHNGSIRLR